MASNPRPSRRIGGTQAALVALWLVAAGGISALMIHHAVDQQRGADAVLSGVANTAAHISWSMAQRGRSSQDIVNSITAMAKTSGVDASASILPGPSPELSPPPVPPGRAGDRVYFMPPVGYETAPGLFNSPSLVVRTPGSVITLTLHNDTFAQVMRVYLIVMLSLLMIALVVTWIVQRNMVGRALAPIATIEGSLRRLADGEYSRLAIVGHDPSEAAVIDAYNAAADELATSIRLRAEAEANLRQFVAEAGHELRTPLTVVMGFVDVLRQGAIAEQALAQRILDSVAVEGERMRLLIGKLLLLARLDAVGSEHFETIDLSALVTNAVDSFRPVAGSTKLSVNVEPNVAVVGSDSELREVVGNLVDNALKYAPGSNVRASVHRNERFAELCVEDDGPGMSAALRARAFDRFSRGDERGSVPGSGLGLAIVKRIAMRSGGDVQLDSNPGAGTKVTVRVPLAES
jgi:two-component system, OmpR family, sensor kinase